MMLQHEEMDAAVGGVHGNEEAGGGGRLSRGRSIKEKPSLSPCAVLSRKVNTGDALLLFSFDLHRMRCPNFFVVMLDSVKHVNQT